MGFAVVLAAIVDIAAAGYQMELADYCFGGISKHQMLVAAVTTEAWSPYSQVVVTFAIAKDSSFGVAIAKDRSFGVAIAFEAAVVTIGVILNQLILRNAG